MKSVKEILGEMGGYLAKRKISAPKRVAEELLGAALGLKRLDLYLNFERPLVEEELSLCRASLKRAGEGEPLAYILGTVDFYNVHLTVDERVLIPRPETELMVEAIISQLEGESLAGKTLWDLCCGSGCIGLALKKALPELEIIGSDLSEEALEVARHNAAKNDLNIEFRQGNFLDVIGEPVDFLVTNPPYVTEAEYEQLPMLRFEPRMALVGGLTFYEQLAGGLPAKLAPGGRAWMEIGSDQGEAVKALFSSSPFSKVALTSDLAGLDRVISLELGG